MKLMFTFIPIIFLFPSVILFAIVWAFKKKHGLGKNSGAGDAELGALDLSAFVSEDGAELDGFDSLAGDDALSFADADAGNELNADSLDSVELSDSYDESLNPGDGEIADIFGTGLYDNEDDFNYVSSAEKRYRHLLLAAILVLVTGIILTVTMYLGIKMTPESGWWPDWWAS